MPEVRSAPVFEFSGGWLCLDFTNTKLGPTREREQFLEYADLVAWGSQADLLSRRMTTELKRGAAAHPRTASRTLVRAIELREAIFRIFGNAAAGGRPAPRDIELLNEHLGPSLAHLRVEVASDGPRWTWDDSGPPLERVLWPVARSAAELLTSDDLKRVRECGSDRCFWLFLDHSRNRSRRWCDMQTCGNRAKARRFYSRKKKD